MLHHDSKCKWCKYCKRCKWYKFEQSDGEFIFFKPGGNRVKSVNRAFYSLIMVEETFSLLCLKGLKCVKGVNHTIWMSEDH